MKFQANKNEIEFKKLFGSRLVPYRKIKSLRITEEGFLFETQNGETIKAQGKRSTPLYDAIVKNHISFRDEENCKDVDRLYLLQEVRSLSAKAMKVAKQVAEEAVKQEIGDDYAVNTVLLEANERIDLCFRLTHDGSIVTDLPEETKDELYEKVSGCFDSMVMARLCEWDSQSDTGKYRIAEELTDPAICQTTQAASMESFLEHWKNAGTQAKSRDDKEQNGQDEKA